MQVRNDIETETPTEEQSIIEITWDERVETDDARRGTMYCFKSCNVNQN